ncbi:lisH domain-containing protein ARMC9-like isoform X3 [Bombus bifarius]|uniref:LisH domain-containing protein ARMC9 n=1 Tax=Bombus bifarius TaxID=103933 RepID=A0A6P8NEL4_9HYME|nr:lisH domain-containing protein ARMC9-like isoform X3 [Bombus vancouverensis nearcticus]XP_033318649.1 lisH domain-containing protein ARMC9-like isoform X3 [Bombus bifarius]
MDKNRAINKMDNKELKLVHQFLIDHDFENTADALMVEATIKGFKHLKNDLQTEGDMYENCYEQLMFSYKTGDWKTFFNLWNLIVPEDAKQTKACKILMLHIYVYFAMLPKHMLMLHWYKKKDKIQAAVSDLVTSSNQQDSECEENFMTEIEKNMNDSMERLRTFLNTTGKELENDAELRPYFAFPFMEDPYAEPFLSNIFEKSWTDKLTNHLQLFLKNYKQQSFSNTKYNDENSDKFSSSYTSLSEDSKKDVIAKKAIKNNNVPIIPNDRNIPMFLEDDESEEQPIFYDSIKYSQKSKSIQTVSMNSSEEEIYSSHFTKRNKKLMQCTQELAVAKSHLCSVHSNYEKLKIRFHKLHADYHKLMSIARVLTSALEDSVKGQVIDFQAMLETCIRIFPDLFNQNIKDSIHKITFSQPGERDETVHEYISKDLLGLHSQIASYRGKSILPYLLTPQNIIIPHPLQQSVTRLLNALASFRCGRDYLSFDSTVVDTVFKCMNSISDNNIDTLTCNMMIAMLQKLSLRKQQRIYMIENGLMEWLIHHLHDQYRVMDSYRLEYATALLMNLSLHQTAQRRVSTMAPLLMSTLIDLLLMDHESALPYINGALNNFLTNHVFNEEAKRIKFSSIIEQYSKYKTGEIRKHLDHILKIHRGEITIKTEDEEMADNDNEEFDVLESQLDENDPVKNNYGELCGESLLESCYTILPKAIQEKETISDELSFPQLKTEAIDSAMQNNQIKNLSSEHESIQHEEILPRKLVNSKPNVKTKTNIVILQNSIKKTISYPKPQPRVVELKSSSTKVFNEKLTIKLKFKIYIYNVFKDRQIFKVQVANERWNSKNDKTFVKEIHNESAMYLYENHTSKESSKTTLASSMLLGIGSEAESTVMEKLSSIASLNTEDSNRIANDKVSWTQETKSDTEEAFLAKPKLPRTPP